MSSKENLISTIIELEWSMFQNVRNVGGKASCQEDLQTFRIARSANFASWSEATLESYLDDLKGAEKNKRNLLTEKYARMMKSTAPMEYSRIEHLLPPLDNETLLLIDKIVEIELEWEEELLKKFPYVIKRGRPLRSSEDTQFVTSFETYLRGELATYSKRTLKLYYEHRLLQKNKNINGNMLAYEIMAKQHGYRSLEEANEKLKSII